MPEEPVVAATPTEEAPKETPVAAPARHISHSYQDDLSQAMNATDATVVQELLSTAREQEQSKKTETKENRERKWYTATSLTLVLLAIAAAGYGAYYYMRLTVPVVENISIGVFPTTESFVASATDIKTVVTKLQENTALKKDTPYLVPIVGDSASQNLLTNAAFFDFLQAKASEPFVGVFDSARLGVMNTGVANVPFIIGSVKDPVTATKEFLIAEPTLLSMFQTALGIDPNALPAQIGTTFTQAYRYNLPVRILSYTDQDGVQKEIFFYGFATDHILLVTTDPLVLQSVFDTIIQQQ